MNKDTKYFNFPLSFLKRNDYDFICSWSIMNYTKNIKYQLEEVARQVLYQYFRHPDNLPAKIYEALAELFEEIPPDGGFAGDNFSPDYEIETLLNHFQEDNTLKVMCVKFYQYLQAMKVLNLTGGHYEEIDISSPPGDAWTSVKTTYLFDARDGKLPDDLFRLIAAVKSVIGKRNFCKSYKKVILARMFGEKKHTEKLYRNKEYLRLSKRYHWDKLLIRAEQRGLLTYIPAGRGYYFSIKYKDARLRKEILKHENTPKKKRFIKKDILCNPILN